MNFIYDFPKWYSTQYTVYKNTDTTFIRNTFNNRFLKSSNNGLELYSAFLETQSALCVIHYSFSHGCPRGRLCLPLCANHQTLVVLQNSYNPHRITIKCPLTHKYM